MMPVENEPALDRDCRSVIIIIIVNALLRSGWAALMDLIVK
jgi:hypothetical protein